MLAWESWMSPVNENKKVEVKCSNNASWDKGVDMIKIKKKHKYIPSYIRTLNHSKGYILKAELNWIKTGEIFF